MSVTVKITTLVEAIIGGETKSVGSLTVPTEITTDGECFDVTAQITNAADPNDFVRQLLWSAGDGGIDDFDVLVLSSDTDVLIELKNTDATYTVHQIEANVPFVLASDDILNTVTVDGTETTLFAIDQIAVQNNNDDTSTATVRLMLFT